MSGRYGRAQVVVIAREPVPGKVKTRLTPPFLPARGGLRRRARQDESASQVTLPGRYWSVRQAAATSYGVRTNRAAAAS